MTSRISQLVVLNTPNCMCIKMTHPFEHFFILTLQQKNIHKDNLHQSTDLANALIIFIEIINTKTNASRSLMTFAQTFSHTVNRTAFFFVHIILCILCVSCVFLYDGTLLKRKMAAACHLKLSEN